MATCRDFTKFQRNRFENEEHEHRIENFSDMVNFDMRRIFKVDMTGFKTAVIFAGNLAFHGHFSQAFCDCLAFLYHIPVPHAEVALVP